MYNIIEFPFSTRFVVVYVVFLLIYVVNLFVKFVFNAKELKWIGLRKRFFKFIAYLVVFSAINYIVNYLFRPANILTGFTVALGTSFGIPFYDLMFFKKEDIK